MLLGRNTNKEPAGGMWGILNYHRLGFKHQLMCQDVTVKESFFLPAGKSARIFLLVICFGGSHGQIMGKKK